MEALYANQSQQYPVTLLTLCLKLINKPTLFEDTNQLQYALETTSGHATGDFE
jgi:hypothetical protein